MPLFKSRSKPADTANPQSSESPWFAGRPETEVARFGRVGVLPANIVAMMDQFGRYTFDPMGAGVIDGDRVWQNLVAPLYPLSQEDGHGFVRELAAAVLPAGGWAVYGGSHLVKELLGGDYDDLAHRAIRVASLDFLRSCGVPRLRLNGYENAFWAATKGKTEPWLTARPLPTMEQAPITDLAAGETRKVAQLEAFPGSNTYLVRLRPDGIYVAVVDAANTDGDQRRAEYGWLTAASLYDLYAEMANALQVPPYWCDPELAPYFPYPKPAIDWLPGASR